MIQSAVYARRSTDQYGKKSSFVIRTVRALGRSTVGVGRLTHVSVVGRFVVNVVVDPTRDEPLANGVIHRDAAGTVGFGFTTTNAQDLEDAGRALIEAADVLRAAQGSSAK